MSARPTRILFQSHNRQGMGHLMRGLNIAREIIALDPKAEIHFYVKAPPTDGLFSERFRFLVEPDKTGLTHWPDAVRSLLPDAIVFDTLLPKDPAAEPWLPSVRYAYVMRKCVEVKQQEVFEHPLIARMDVIVVPHTAEEFGYDLPQGFASRTHFVGPIVRALDPAVQAILREKYRLQEGDQVIVSTVGGGGDQQTSEIFFSAVTALHGLIQPRLPRLRHLVVQGPKFRGTVVAADGMTVIASEPELGNLLALAHLVIAEGGYNTANEIRLAKRPAVFLPVARKYDDPEERVRALERLGLAFVFPDKMPERIAATILELYNADGLGKMQGRYREDLMVVGNRAAAKHILETLR